MKPENESVVYPNPFTERLEITFRETPSQLTVEIFNGSGKLISITNYQEYVSRSVALESLRNLPAGIYFIRLTTPGNITNS